MSGNFHGHGSGIGCKITQLPLKPKKPTKKMIKKLAATLNQSPPPISTTCLGHILADAGITLMIFEERKENP